MEPMRLSTILPSLSINNVKGIELTPYLASLGKMINKYQTKERSYPLLIGVG